MSEAMTALSGVVFEAGIATVREAGAQGMITLRGDLNSDAVRKALKAATGNAMPEQRFCAVDGDTGAAWMSPDELLILTPYAGVHDTIAKLQKALGSTHALVVNVSDARAMFFIEGPHAADVLSKLCPVDLSPEGLQAGMIRRTRMAQVPAALWQSGADRYSVICFRSQAQYVFDLLSVAAQEGSEIDSF